MLANATRSDDRPTAVAPGLPLADGATPQREVRLATAFLRYLDVVLIIASTPFVLLAGAPVAGFAIGAAAWILIRYGVAVVEARAWASRNANVRTALHLAALLGRVWLIALAVLLARFAIGTADGIAAALVVLAAYTVELVTKLMLRRQITAGLRRAA
jgi:hypothetical protein